MCSRASCIGEISTNMNKLNHYLLAIIMFATACQMSAQQFFFSSERPGSCSATDGILTIVPTRGVAPFTYLWSDGSTEVSIKNQIKGAYSATITDAVGATIAHTYHLNSVEFDLQQTGGLPVGLCAPNTGMIALTPDGGQAPYTYTWSNGMTGSTISGLAAGTYTVTAVDATGCQATGEYTVAQLTSNYYIQSEIGLASAPDCANPNGGELNTYLSHGAIYPPFSYNWSNGATTPTISGVPTGLYVATITDALGCAVSNSILLGNKMNNAGSVVCSGNNIGTVSAELVNGAAPITYNWSNGASGPTQSNLSSGSYLVTATDANGCSASEYVQVAIPILNLQDNSQKCYTGNNGVGYCWVYWDQGTSFLWDDGNTSPWNATLSQGNHNITVTTSLGCVLNGTLTIAPPAAAPFTFNTSPTPADCVNGLGGAMNLSISGGVAPFNFAVYGPNGFFSSDVNSLQNIQAGEYQLSAYSTAINACYGNATVSISDQGGFEPQLQVTNIDCLTGVGSAAIVNVTTPGVQYNWSEGSSSQALFNLTQGCYSVTVTAGASCNQFYQFCLYNEEDSLQMGSVCYASAKGKLINDLGVPGCIGTTGIPYQLIRTLPSGALNFTDENGDFQVNTGAGAYEIATANYDPADIACPPTGKYSFNAVAGTTLTGLDFHFLSNSNIDHRVRQRALRTAQPGYPYSLRFEVCNDGAAANPGTLDVEYGNFLGLTTGHNFPQHPGAYAFTSEASGAPNNSASFSFPGVAPGACELLQIDLQTQTTTPVNSPFLSIANVSPSSGDPTPANNISTLQSTVMGSFDPNCVLSYPARNGNPKDGGEILRNQDNTVVYQIFFQNTGNAPADLVVVRDPLDENLDLSTIRNITATHDMKISTDNNDKILVFRFNNINLPDSTTDYAGSIGSIQYEIDLKPGLSLGTDIKKQVGIFFDFNQPVITNENVLEVVSALGTKPVIDLGSALTIFPNPTDAEFGFHCDTTSKMRIYNALGVLMSTETVEGGLKRVSTVDFPSGIYLVQLETNGKIRNGKVVVTHK